MMWSERLFESRSAATLTDSKMGRAHTHTHLYISQRQSKEKYYYSINVNLEPVSKWWMIQPPLSPEPLAQTLSRRQSTPSPAPQVQIAAKHMFVHSVRERRLHSPREPLRHSRGPERERVAERGRSVQKRWRWRFPQKRVFTAVLDIISSEGTASLALRLRCPSVTRSDGPLRAVVGADTSPAEPVGGNKS